MVTLMDKQNYKQLLKTRIENTNAVYNLGLSLKVNAGWKQVNAVESALFSAGTYKQTFDLLCVYVQGIETGGKRMKGLIYEQMHRHAARMEESLENIL